MSPFFRSKKSEPFGNDPELENANVEENGGTGEEFDADVETEDPVDDGIFVTENGRKRRSSVAKAVTYAAMGLAVAGTGFATGYGVNVAVRRSRNSPAAALVEEQTQVENMPFAKSSKNPKMTKAPLAKSSKSPKMTKAPLAKSSKSPKVTKSTKAQLSSTVSSSNTVPEEEAVVALDYLTLADSSMDYLV